MDALKSTGLQVAGASLVGAVASYFMLRDRDSPAAAPKPKKRTSAVGKSSCITLFFNEEGSQCSTRLDHVTDDCPLEECQERHLRTLKRLVGKAKSSVDVCLYNLSQHDLEATLAGLLRDGKRVRCVVGGRGGEDERNYVRKLRSEGAFVTVKDHTPPERLPFKCNELLMHHKFVIIDDQILVTGSMNWTKTSFHRNWDHMLICVDSHLVQQFKEEFTYLFSTENKNEVPCTIRPTSDLPFQACFFRRTNIMCRGDANKKKKCEKENCMFYVYKSIMHKIVSATVSIDICVQQITVEDLCLEVIFAHENGIKVRVITEGSFSNGTGSQIEVFRRAGIPIRMQTGDGTLHHKFIIVDGKILLSGSLNWTMQSFYGNYENVLVISQKAVVDRFQKEFESLWECFNR